MNDRLQKLIDWVRAKENRTIEIKIGDSSNNNSFSLWAYDYELQEGEYISLDHIGDIDKLDLTEKAKAKKRQEYEELKAEFEGKQEAAK